MSQDDPLQLVGTIVADKYDVEKLVAEGGFALLYRATHQIWRRPVALKVFKILGEATKANKEELLANFIREGALLADLSERSASICQARDVGMLRAPGGETIPYMVLEWLEGRSLEEVLEDETARSLVPRTLGETMNLLGPVAEALALAHTLRVAHRDVKPANIFLLGDPRAAVCPVKLLDFGIAKVVMDAHHADGAFEDTTGGLAAFTPSYAAPEQFSRSLGPTGPWTDTFALALVLVECLTGQRALQGDDFLQIAYSAGNLVHRPTPRASGATVSDEVEAVFERALAVNVAARYATVGEFWNALRLAIGEEPMTLSPPSSWAAAQSRGPRSVGPPSSLLRAPAAAPPLAADGPVDATVAIASGPAGAPPSPAPTARPSISAPLSLAALLATTLLAGWIGVRAVRHRQLPPAVVASARAAASGSEVASAPAAPPAPAPAVACPDGMVYVGGGQFFMGADDGLPMEKPSHNVKLAPFCIGIYEVTTEKYLACSDRGGCKRASRVNDWAGITSQDHKTYDPLCNITDPSGRARHPINCVDWERADTYCRATGGRLPTEAEWEFAARGSDGRLYPWGDETPSARYLNACGSECVAWGKAHHAGLTGMYATSDGFETTAPVGSFPEGKSRFGLMDVVGNVWEWVADWYAPYENGALVDPKGPETGTRRVMRGGAWNGAEPSWVRPTFRFMNDPSASSYGVGFRCAADPK